ncbi:MAG TPA: hypothetical protein VJ890_18450 [Vineibacter sp.]|nr:hypothetical protein [Vineibacter sp.]
MTLPTPEFAPLWTPAPPLKAWPPAGYRDVYEVGSKMGASWRAVATGFGIPDVWDLIWFNFRTDDARKVNWYMHQKLGCYKSNDGKNFSFKGAKPGLIYIPPFNWRRPDTLGGKVAESLARLAPHFPYVIWSNVHVHRTDLMHIVHALRLGRIVVRHDPTLTVLAHYDGSLNPEELTLSSRSVRSLENRRTFVHEAVHAILDMKRYTLRRWQNELIAYAVEAVVTLHGFPAYAEQLRRGKGSNAVERAALTLATVIHADKGMGAAAIRLEDYQRWITNDEGVMFNPFSDLRNKVWAYGDEDPRDLIIADGVF